MNIDVLACSAAAAVGVAVLVAAFALRRRRGAAGKVAELASRPAALRTAKLVYMEEQFRIRDPTPLVARIDRAYRGADGALVLVELKTRRTDRAYASDVIQISVQKMALEGQTRQRVAAYGFVAVQLPNGGGPPSFHRVKLVDASKVIVLHSRREGILSGQVKSRYAESSSACRGCALRAWCDSPGA